MKHISRSFPIVSIKLALIITGSVFNALTVVGNRHLVAAFCTTGQEPSLSAFSLCRTPTPPPSPPSSAGMFTVRSVGFERW